MSEPKELNFFFGPENGQTPTGNRHTHSQFGAWTPGNWHRGPDWYAGHFVAGSPVRGESSPGYTSPSHPGVAQRMAKLIPWARLVYLVRDPVDRALSQYRHHRAEGSETRPLDEALLDRNSQYVARGRYHERLLPFLEHFGRRQIAIVAREEMLTQRRSTLRSLFGLLGVDQDFWAIDLERLWNASEGRSPGVGKPLRERLADALVDDADRLRELAGRDFPGWSV